jgi:hypothetical protein
VMFYRGCAGLVLVQPNPCMGPGQNPPPSG